MPILEARLTNVYASLDAYLTANLLFPDGTPIALKLHGVRRFVPPTDDPWVEAHYDFLGLTNVFHNRAGMGEGPQLFSTERQGYVQLNAYQRARVYTQRYTTAAIADLIGDIFPESGVIPVYDYRDVLPDQELVQEATVIADGYKGHVVDTGVQSGVVQYVVEVQTRYFEIYTRV